MDGGLDTNFWCSTQNTARRCAPKNGCLERQAGVLQRVGNHDNVERLSWLWFLMTVS